MYLSQRARTFTVLFFLLWLTAAAFTAQLSFASTRIYSYIDDAGVHTFTNQFDSIPDKYRNQLTQREDEAPAAAEPAVSTAPSPPSADSRIVTASGEHRMSDHDRRTDAVRLAVEAAKKDALEQVATYLESVTEVRNMDVTRDDIRSFTAGIVKIVKQSITPRLEDGAVVIRADLTAEIDPHEVAQAIAALRENDSAKQELLALRAETDRLQEQLDATSRALAAAPSPDEAQQLSREREGLLNELQATGLVSQAWTSVVYATPGFYSYPSTGVAGVNGLLLQAQGLYPRHRHLPLAQQYVAAQPGRMSPTTGGASALPPRHTLLVPTPPHAHSHQSPPLLTPAGVPAKVGDIVSMSAPRSVPPVMPQSIPPSTTYQLHPSHFWRPSPPNIHSAPTPSPQPNASISPPHFGGHTHSSGGGQSQAGSGGNHGGRGR
jgi:hypothetical protein